MIRQILLALFVIVGVTAGAVDVSVNAIWPAQCGLPNGRIDAYASGGIPPYSYLWSNGATTQSITDLPAGDYTVTVTDGLNNTAQATGTVEAVFQLSTAFSNAIVLQPDCQGMCTGIIGFEEFAFGGTPPYSYGGYPVFQWGASGEMAIDGVCSGQDLIIPVSDVNGCSDQLYFSGFGISVDPPNVTVQNITPACSTESNGTMTVVLDGPEPGELEVVHTGGMYTDIHYPTPGEPYTITGLPAGDYDLTSSIPGWQIPLFCSAYFTAMVPALPAPCGSISGVVFNDADQNCVKDPLEYGLPYRVLTIQPGPAYAFTNDQGQFTQASAFGNFTIEQTLVDESQLCPPDAMVQFTIDAMTPDVTVEFADSSFVPLDLEIHNTITAMRPGFDWQLWISVWNNSPYPSGPAIISLNYDPALDPLSYGAAGTAVWNTSSIAPYSYFSYSITGQLPPDILLLGTVFNFNASVSNSLPESDLTNNALVVNRTVTGSYDPNDKKGNTSSRESDHQYFLDLDDYIDYTVRFQNTGSDTAFTVEIRDMIDTDLDITSLEILGASHSFIPSFGEVRELVFTFNDINLPDSTTDLLGSQGFISYRIKPNAGIIVGDVIENTAEIFFDFNPAIVTNTTSHVVDLSTGIQESDQVTIRLTPNPTTDQLTVILPGASTWFELIAMDGKRINVPITRNGTSVILDVRALASGIYTIRTVSGSARFVKQ